MRENSGVVQFMYYMCRQNVFDVSVKRDYTCVAITRFINICSLKSLREESRGIIKHTYENNIIN